MQSKPKALRLTHPRSATAMPAPNFPSSNHRAQFIPARDSRNRRIPGLYIRGSPLLRAALGRCGKREESRAPFSASGTATIKRCTLSQLRVKHSKSSDMNGAKISFQQSATNLSLQIIVTTYFEKAKVQRKRPGTVANERQAIARWRDHLGHVRIDQIATPAITRLTSTSG